MKSKNMTLSAAIGMMLLGTHTLATAADDRVSVHGYGDTGFIHAKENNFTNKFSGNDWDYNYLSVNFTAQIDNQTKIVAQIRQGSEITGDMGAYVNYNMTDDLTVRAGQIKAPVGIFNEIRDIKFLQLSAVTPLMYQDAVGFLPDSFKGIEAIYHWDMGSHRLTFDAYAGEPKGANNYVDRGQVAPSLNYYQLVQNIVGGRLTYKTPVGLKFSLSSFQNKLLSTFADSAILAGLGLAVPTPNGVLNPTEGTRTFSSASIDYRKYDIDIKLEYATAKDDFQTSPLENNKGAAYYGQIGYTIAQKFTPFIRYDSVLYNDTQKTNPMMYQKTKVAGLNYRLNNNVSMRLENHWNEGYAITASAQGSGFTTTPTLEWKMFAMGLNFIF
jgi:hypothetical protein